MKRLIVLVALALSLVLGLAFVFMACSGAPQPTTTPTIPATTETLGIEQPNWWVTATDSVEERIFEADVIVRATLLSTGDGPLRFRAVEYLKGTGAAEFQVNASTSQRNTSWDDREALLFLSLPDADGASGASTPDRFQFTPPSLSPYKGDLPEGYSVDKRNPVWLPQEQSISSGASGQSDDNPTFITDAEPLSGTGDAPTITLTDLKAKIAWIDGGEGVTWYDQCIRQSLSSIRYYRDFEHFFGSPWEPPEHSMEIESGLASGTLATGYGTDWPERFPAHHQVWLSGEDADLFEALIVDDDEDPSNGFTHNAFTVRPLPNGTYQFTYRLRFWDTLPCDFQSQGGRGHWTLTVTAPEGTVHEAFFDPADLQDGVGFSADGGVLEPSRFTTFNTDTEITDLVSSGDTVTMTLMPYVDLTFDTLDFIALDGSVAVSLSDGTGDATAGTITWEATAPWSSGDQLMLRIVEGEGRPVPKLIASEAAPSPEVFFVIPSIGARLHWDEMDDLEGESVTGYTLQWSYEEDGIWLPATCSNSDQLQCWARWRDNDFGRGDTL